MKIPSIPRSPDRPVRQTAYYHDQRGVSHEAGKLVVPEYFEKLDTRIREEYLEGKKDVSEEIERLRRILPMIKEDSKALEILASLIENCAAYSERIIRHAMDANDVSEDDPLKFTAALVESDKLRRFKHDALIVDLKAFRTYMMKNYGPEGKIAPHDESVLSSSVLYTGTSTGREAIGHWAIRFVDAIAHLPAQQREELFERIPSPEAEAAE